MEHWLRLFKLRTEAESFKPGQGKCLLIDWCQHVAGYDAIFKLIVHFMQSINNANSSQALSTTQVQAVKNFYAGLSQVFEFHKGLTLVERRRMMRPTRQNLLLVQDSLDAIAQIPELCPSYLDQASVEDTSELFHQLRYLEQVHKQVGDALKDLRLMVGDDAFRNARLIYNSVKTAAEAGYPKARPIYQQMNMRFATARANLGIAEGENDMDDMVETVVELNPTSSESQVNNKAA